jgi:hypothetical protein
MEEDVVQRGRDIGPRTTSWLSSCIYNDEDISMSRAEWKRKRAKARKMESASLSTYHTYYCSACLFGELSKLEKLRPDVLATRA